MLEGLDSLFRDTELVVEPNFQKGMQHHAARLVSLDGNTPDKPRYAKWVRTMGLWDDSSAESAVTDLIKLHHNFQGVAKIAPTEIYSNVSVSVQGSDKPAFYPSYAIIQHAVPGAEVSERDLQMVSNIRDTVRDALLASWAMYLRNGEAVDIVGFDTIKDILNKPFDNTRELRLHNLRKLTPWQPALIDTRLLAPKRVKLPIRPFTDYLIQLQHFGLERLLNKHASPSEKFRLEGGNQAIRTAAEKCFDFTQLFEGQEADL